MKASDWIPQADQAMVRAAARARAVAAGTRTSLHILKDGEIVEVMPVQPIDEPKLSVVREDMPAYGNQKS